MNYVKREYNLIIGERTAEELKMRIGSAAPLTVELSMSVKGRDAVVGLPRTIVISSSEVREALKDAITSIVNVVKSALEQCPPELSSDLVDRGIVLAGGGAMVKNLDVLLSIETGLPVVVANDPLSAVANGTGTVLQDLSVWFDNE
jgi:rod shape-determining protein MreB